MRTEIVVAAVSAPAQYLSIVRVKALIAVSRMHWAKNEYQVNKWVIKYLHKKKNIRIQFILP